MLRICWLAASCSDCAMTGYCVLISAWSAASHPHQRTEPKPVRTKFDTPERRGGERVDIDDEFGPHDIELHQIEQRRAPGKIFGAAFVARCRLRGKVRGIARIGRPLVDECAHDYSVLAVFIAVLACLTAPTILG